RGVEADGSPADGLDQPLAVEEADRLDLPRRRRGDRERGAAPYAGRTKWQEPRHGRSRRAADVDALDRRVRQDVGADLIDVLRLLVVRSQRSAFEQTSADGRSRTGDAEERQPAGRDAEGSPEHDGPPVLAPH